MYKWAVWSHESNWESATLANIIPAIDRQIGILSVKLWRNWVAIHEIMKQTRQSGEWNLCLRWELEKWPALVSGGVGFQPVLTPGGTALFSRWCTTFIWWRRANKFSCNYFPEEHSERCCLTIENVQSDEEGIRVLQLKLLDTPSDANCYFIKSVETATLIFLAASIYQTKTQEPR